MYYVYCESYYHVWEPAEGGYYVRCSRIDDYVACDTIEEAHKEFIESVWQAEKQGCELENVNFDIPYPFANFDGFTIAISQEKPKDKPYEGYR